jgi:hypothetical protein
MQNTGIIIKIPNTQFNIWFEAIDETNNFWNITLENKKTHDTEKIKENVKIETCIWLLTDIANNSNKKYKKHSKKEITKRIITKIDALEN